MSIAQLLQRVRDGQQASARAQAIYASRLAPAFSPFDFIAPDEMKLSQLLAWLLDPKGSHAQGTLFLCSYVRRFGLLLDLAQAGDARVGVEVLTDVLDDWNRRVDVLVRIGAHAIVIENKPWADDQPGQVAHYLSWLDATTSGEKRLIYLTQGGAAPQDKSIPEAQRDQRQASGELVLQSFIDVADWIDEIRGQCRADRVNAFLAEFAQYLRRAFGAIADMNQREDLLAQVTESPELLAAALQVMAAGPDIKRALVRKLYDQIEAAVGVEKPLWTTDENLNAGSWPGFSIHFGGMLPAHFRIEFPNRQFGEMYYGLKHEVFAAPQLAAGAVRAKLPDAGKSNDIWPWYRLPGPKDALWPHDGRWAANEDAWVGVVRGTLAGEVIKVASVLEDAIKALALP